MIGSLLKPHSFPYPILGPNSMRLPKGKSMTLIAGFRCWGGGILMCADREESGDGTKRSVDKLWEWKWNDAHFIVGAAGTSVILANLKSKLRSALEQNSTTLLESHVDIIQDVLQSIHRDYREFKECEEMVIAASFYKSASVPVASFLYGTVWNKLEPVPDYVCKGGGRDLAGYFCHRLYSKWPDRRQAVILATFIFRETEDHVGGVGRGTDMLYLDTQRRLAWSIPHSYIADLERLIPSLRETVAERWNNGLEVPEWLVRELFKGENELFQREL